ncbi:MAG: hypothetical protein KKF48_00170 [Nanoarchaeota archaeon]|nr:hypothetical protein [Nanoarchaeota archaeon]MBU1027439.1 hypothetical protein [Nanoarchaeota archaeon]
MKDEKSEGKDNEKKLKLEECTRKLTLVHPERKSSDYSPLKIEIPDYSKLNKDQIRNTEEGILKKCVKESIDNLVGFKIKGYDPSSSTIYCELTTQDSSCDLNALYTKLTDNKFVIQ